MGRNKQTVLYHANLRSKLDYDPVRGKVLRIFVCSLGVECMNPREHDHDGMRKGTLWLIGPSLGGPKVGRSKVAPTLGPIRYCSLIHGTVPNNKLPIQLLDCYTMSTIMMNTWASPGDKYREEETP